MYKTIYELVKLKESDTLHILGSSESVNDLTDDQWNKILTDDTFGINNWIYHPTIVPKFYTIELKAYDFDIMKRRFNEKWDRYKNVNYVLAHGRTNYIAGAIGHRKEAKIYEVPVKLRGCHPGEEPKNAAIFRKTKKVKFDPEKYDADYKAGSVPLTKSYDTSITFVIDLAYRMGYKKIVLHGHDYFHSRYFWFSGDPKYGEVHCRHNKQHEGKDPGEPHNTLHIMNFMVDFNRRHLLPQGREMFIGSKKSLLYPRLRYYLD